MNKNFTNTLGIWTLLKQFTYHYQVIDLSSSFLMLQTECYLDIQIKSYGQNRRTMQNNILAVMCRHITSIGRRHIYYIFKACTLCAMFWLYVSIYDLYSSAHDLHRSTYNAKFSQKSVFKPSKHSLMCQKLRLRKSIK